MENLQLRVVKVCVFIIRSAYFSQSETDFRVGLIWMRMQLECCGWYDANKNKRCRYPDTINQCAASLCAEWLL